MPYKRGYAKRRQYKKKRNYRRKNYVRRPRISKRKPLTVSVHAPIADKLFVKLHYCELYNTPLTIADTVSTICVFQNSLYDPRFSAGGHQPMWRDQYATLYGSYRVIGIGYSVTAVNISSNYSFFLAVRRSNSSTTADTSIEQFYEREDCQVRMGSGYGGGSPRVQLSGYMSVAKTRGVAPHVVRNEANYSAAFGADPATQCYLQLCVQAAGTTTIQSITRLTYYCELFDPVTPGAS